MNGVDDDSSKQGDRVCVKCWDDNVKVTKLDPCNHWICTNCYQELYRIHHPTGESLESLHSLATIKCPACQTMSNLARGPARAVSRLESVCGESVIGRPDEPCSHKDPKQTCGHCDKIVCPDCTKRHKLTIRNDIFEMTRKLGSLLPMVKRKVDFRAVSLRYEDEVSKLSYFLDEKISLVMKTLNDQLLAVRNEILEDARSKLSDEILEAKAKYGDFKQTKLIVGDLKSPTVYAATPIEDAVASFKLIKQQLGAVEAVANDYDPDSDEGFDSPVLAETFNQDGNKKFDAKLDSLVSNLATTLLRGGNSSPTSAATKSNSTTRVVAKPIVEIGRTEVFKEVATNTHEWSSSPDPTFEETKFQSPAKRSPMPVPAPEPIWNQTENINKNTETSDWDVSGETNKVEKKSTKNSDWDWSGETNNVEKKSTVDNNSSALSNSFYTSLSVSRLVTEFNGLTAKFLRPSWLFTSPKLGKDRFVCTHNSNRISVIGTNLSILNTFRVMSPDGDADSMVLCGDIIFHDGFFYFGDYSRQRIFRFRTDFSKVADSVVPELFFDASQKLRGERMWGLDVCNTTKQLIVASDSAVVSVDIKDSTCMRYLLQRPALHYYLNQIAADESSVIFTKRREVIRKKIYVRDGCLHFEEGEELLSRGRDLVAPRGIVIDPTSGNLTVAEKEGNRLSFFRPNGQLIGVFSPPPSVLNGSRFDPNGVILFDTDSSSPVLVVSEFLNHRLVLLKPNSI